MDKTQHNKDSVSQKILETTRETERLKRELEALIASGIRGRTPDAVPSTSQIALSESTNKAQIIKSYDSKHSQHVRGPLEITSASLKPKIEAEALSPKKPKTYNVDDAREYMKKQRGQRLEELKNKKSYSKIAAEVRKEKLQELQQKASEIVRRNVEAKRARSKSREPPIVRSTTGSREPQKVLRSRSVSKEKKTIDPEESVIEGFNCAIASRNFVGHSLGEDLHSHLKSRSRSRNKAVSLERLKLVEPNKKYRNPNLLYPPETTYGATQLEENIHEYFQSGRGETKTADPKDAGGPNAAASIPNLLLPPESKYGFTSSLETEHPRRSESNITNIDYAGQKHIDKSHVYPDEARKASSKPDLTLTSSTKHSTSEIRQPLEMQQVEKSNIVQNYPKNTSSQRSLNKPKMNVLSNITLRKPTNDISLMAQDQENPKQIPDWLKEQSQTDPFNFINTVKRQLKYVVSDKQPSFVDVGVQGNLEDISSAANSGKSSKKTDLKSFISHKCLNLDPKTIEHIELNRHTKEFYAFKDGPTMTKPSSSENDSDTSKNIPSISSESGSSLRRNAEFIKRSYALSELKPLENAPPNLDVKKVEEIRLKDTEVLSQNTSLLSVPSQDEIYKIKKQLFRDSDHYSSDFVATDLSKSRDSILSFNCAKVSPSVSPNRVSFSMPDAQVTNSEPVGNSEPISEEVKSETQTNAFLANENLIQRSENMLNGSDSLLNRNITTRKSSEGSVKPKEYHPSEQIMEVFTTRNKYLDSGWSSVKFCSLSSTLIPSTHTSDFQQSRKSGSTESQRKISGNSESHQSESRQTGTIESQKEFLTDNPVSPESFGNRNGSDVLIRTSQNTEMLNVKATFSGSENSEKRASQKRHKSVLSKSESDVYADKENVEEPKLSLNIKRRNRKADADDRQALMRNITIRSGDLTRKNLNNPDEIHLKFEAEIHLLSDFNQTIQKFSEIERTFESLRTQNRTEPVGKKVLQNRDTQTSIISSPATVTISQEVKKKPSKSSTDIPSEIKTDQGKTDLQVMKHSEINSENLLLDLTHASDVNSALTTIDFDDSLLDNVSEKTISMLQFSQSNLEESSRDRGESGDENAVFQKVVGMSLKMFDQLINDEDARIENLKKVLKIREQALLDRTRGELVWLEMQKKQLIETGKLAEASLIKKKQRGILLKHQQERHEMQRPE